MMKRHTAKRIFERLRDEYGFTGGLTIVKDYVAGSRLQAQEMFVPLEHPPDLLRSILTKPPVSSAASGARCT
jgi:hypothetical protein